MQRLVLCLLMWALLYSAGPALASPDPVPPPARPVLAALILPLKSPSFASVATAVLDGFKAATRLPSNHLIRDIIVYETSDDPEDVLLSYRKAQYDGARIIIGPLTRDGVNAVIQNNFGNTPTLTLYLGDGSLPPGMYGFGLSADAEARQAARLAFEQGRRALILLTGPAPLDRRITTAFAAEWKRLGGTIADQIPLTGDPALFARLKGRIQKTDADALFIAADGELATAARPYLGNDLPVYATSHLYTGKPDGPRSPDLNGTFLADMPWLLQPDHPAVMVYPREESSRPLELERFYALGIDAFRLAEFLARGRPPEEMVLDGVTGTLRLDGQFFRRELIPAQIRHGRAVPLSP
jgi:hypothetical protein